MAAMARMPFPEFRMAGLLAITEAAPILMGVALIRHQGPRHDPND
jgi:hypothetical protein